jgi:hypothetical protein
VTVEVIARAEGGSVAKSSFVRLKRQFDNACRSLRAFTLGQRGCTQRGGLAAVARVSGVCDQLKKLFPSGPHAGEAAALVVSGRTRVAATEARLALLRGRRLRGDSFLTVPTIDPKGYPVITSRDDGFAVVADKQHASELAGLLRRFGVGCERRDGPAEDELRFPAGVKRARVQEILDGYKTAKGM